MPVLFSTVIRPGSSLHNRSNAASCDTVHSRDHLFDKHSAERTYLPRLLVSEFSHAVVVSFRSWWHRSVASLCVHVTNIVGSGSKKKVGRVDAQSIIALVADQQAIWDWPEMDQPRGSVGVLAAACVPSYRQRPVSDLEAATKPCPARSKFGSVFRYWPVSVDSGKESCSERVRISLRKGWVLCKRLAHNQVCFGLPRLRLFVQRAGTLNILQFVNRQST